MTIPLLKITLLCVAISFVWLCKWFAGRRWLSFLGFLLTIGGIAAWWNFSLSNVSRPHLWEQFHYVLSAKYFPEIRYDGLYQCAVEAVVEDEKAPSEIKSFRDLTDNRYRTLAEQLALHGPCKRRFTSQRWIDWRRDVAWFYAEIGPNWNRMLFDHGCNASPFWLAIGKVWIGDTFVSANLLLWNLVLDCVLIAAMWAAFAVTLGVCPTAVAAVLWGTNSFGGFQWTGGAFLRKEWLVAFGFSIVFLARRKTFLAGVVAGYSVLSRVLPLLSLIWIFLATLRSRTTKQGSRFNNFMKGLLAMLVLGVIVSALGFGTVAWSDFFSNLRKHQVTEGGNVVGLNRLLRNVALCRFGPFGNTDETCRLPEFRESSTLDVTTDIVSLLIGLGLVAVLGWRCRKLETWAQLAISGYSFLLVTDIASYDTEVLAFMGLLLFSNPTDTGPHSKQTTRSRLCSILLVSNLLLAILEIGRMSGNDMYLIGAAILILALVVALTYGEWETQVEPAL